MDNESHRYSISTPDSDGLTWTIRPQPELEAGQVGRFSLTLQAPRDLGRGSVEVNIRFEAEGDPAIAVTYPARVLLPDEGGSR